MHVSRPAPNEYAPYFSRYISLIAEPDFAAMLGRQPAELRALLGKLSPEQAGFRYAPEKWSIRQVVGHVIDAERVFAYRALAIARGEAASLPSFDENSYAKQAGHDGYPLGELLDEFAQVRQSNLSLFQHMSQEDWERVGTVNQNRVSTRGLAYLLVGHAQHHAGILKERYGVVVC
ncbi:MAG TPA: DinB family protein [Polyangia bacterium]